MKELYPPKGIYSLKLPYKGCKDFLKLRIPYFPKYLDISTPYHTILVLIFEQLQFTTRCCVYKFLDEWQTV